MTSKPTPPALVNLGALFAAVLLVSSLCPEARAADELPADVPKLPRYMRLEYLPPGKNCPDQEALKLEVIASALRDPFKSEAGPVLQVVLKRRGAQYAGRFDVRDTDGHVI